MSGVLTILGKCQVLLNAPDAWKNAAEIIPMRKALAQMSRDESLTLQERYDLAMAAEACKHTINAVPLRARLKGYPESKLYGHETLTSKCRAKVVKLAEKFAFKPQPLALGVKHYFAPK
jgi:hypothetical protein